MVSRLDKVIGIPVRVSTPYTRYGPEYTFTKPFAFPTFMYILLLLTTIFKLILTLFRGTLETQLKIDEGASSQKKWC